MNESKKAESNSPSHQPATSTSDDSGASASSSVVEGKQQPSRETADLSSVSQGGEKTAENETDEVKNSTTPADNDRSSSATNFDAKWVKTELDVDGKHQPTHSKTSNSGNQSDAQQSSRSASASMPGSGPKQAEMEMMMSLIASTLAPGADPAQMMNMLAQMPQEVMAALFSGQIPQGRWKFNLNMHSLNVVE